ncbi:conserved hypothetical protein, partial [Ixodes scapularis]
KHSRKDTAVDTMKGDSDLCADEADLPRKKKKKHRHKDVTMRESQENLDLISTHDSAETKKKKHRNKSQAAYRAHEESDPVPDLDLATRKQKNHRNSKATVDTIDQCLNAVSDVQDCAPRKKKKHKDRHSAADMTQEDVGLEGETDPPTQKKKKQKEKGPNIDAVQNDHHIVAGSINLSTKKRKKHREKERATYTAQESLDGLESNVANSTMRKKNRPNERKKKPSTSHNLRQGDDRVQPSADEDQNLLRNNTEERDCEEVPKKSKHKHCRKDVALEEIVEFDLESGGDPDSSRRRERKKKPSTSHNLRQGDDRVQPSADEGQSLLGSNIEERDCEEVPKKSKHKHCRKDVALEEIVEFDLESGGDPDSSRQRER